MKYSYKERIGSDRNTVGISLIEESYLVVEALQSGLFLEQVPGNPRANLTRKN